MFAYTLRAPLWVSMQTSKRSKQVMNPKCKENVQYAFYSASVEALAGETINTMSRSAWGRPRCSETTDMLTIIQA